MLAKRLEIPEVDHLGIAHRRPEDLGDTVLPSAAPSVYHHRGVSVRAVVYELVGRSVPYSRECAGRLDVQSGDLIERLLVDVRNTEDERTVRRGPEDETCGI